jgi:hypothetical protein
MNFDDLFIAIIIAGMGLTLAFLRAEYALHRGFKAAEHKKMIVQRELHANRLRSKQIDVPVAAIRNHRHFLSKESAICAPAESPPAVYEKIGIRHRDRATQGPA